MPLEIPGGNISKSYKDMQDEKTKNIVRQACIKAACNAYKVNPNYDLKKEAKNITTLAEEFENWIMRP